MSAPSTAAGGVYIEQSDIDAAVMTGLLLPVEAPSITTAAGDDAIRQQRYLTVAAAVSNWDPCTSFDPVAARAFLMLPWAMPSAIRVGITHAAASLTALAAHEEDTQGWPSVTIDGGPERRLTELEVMLGGQLYDAYVSLSLGDRARVRSMWRASVTGLDGPATWPGLGVDPTLRPDQSSASARAGGVLLTRPLAAPPAVPEPRPSCAPAPRTPIRRALQDAAPARAPGSPPGPPPRHTPARFRPLAGARGPVGSVELAHHHRMRPASAVIRAWPAPKARPGSRTVATPGPVIESAGSSDRSRTPRDAADAAGPVRKKKVRRAGERVQRSRQRAKEAAEARAADEEEEAPEEEPEEEPDDTYEWWDPAQDPSADASGSDRRA